MRKIKEPKLYYHADWVDIFSTAQFGLKLEHVLFKCSSTSNLRDVKLNLFKLNYINFLTL